MIVKKVIISILAVAAIAVALYGIVKWQNQAKDQPSRQTQEIRTQ